MHMNMQMLGFLTHRKELSTHRPAHIYVVLIMASQSPYVCVPLCISTCVSVERENDLFSGFVHVIMEHGKTKIVQGRPVG